MDHKLNIQSYSIVQHNHVSVQLQTVTKSGWLLQKRVRRNMNQILKFHLGRCFLLKQYFGLKTWTEEHA